MRVRNHSNPLNFYKTLDKIDFNSVWPDFNGVMDLEIGFGRGLFLCHYAERNPGRHLMGVEVRKSIVTVLQERVDALKLPNIYLVHGTGQRCLEDLIEDNTVQNVFVFHPDPWFKKRHYKRRVINPLLMDTLTLKMKNGGRLYLSTDVSELWDYMTGVISQYPAFSEIKDPAFKDTYYKTHWQLFSDRDGRASHFSVFELTK